MRYPWSNSVAVSPVREREPWTIHHIAETGSTNADLLEAASCDPLDPPHGTVLVTDHQTAGRGRLDRRWDAPPGTNLLASILFRRGFDPAHPHELTRRVAVAAVEAIEQVTGSERDNGTTAAVRAVLKWPNDVLLVIGGNGAGGSTVVEAKVAGILAQAGMSIAGGAVDHAVVDHVVVGMGCNVGWAPPGAARVEGVERDQLLDAWLDALAARFDAPIGDVYRARLATLGQRVRIERDGDDIVGVASDVTEYGELVVDAGDERHVVAVGDVVHLRPLS